MKALDAIKARHEATTQTHWSIEYGNCGCSADAGCCEPGEVWPHVLHGPKNTFPPSSPSEWDNAVSEVAELSEADAEFIVFAHNSDVPRLLAALQAVLALHSPGNEGHWCAHCIHPSGEYPMTYPCPTVTAIQRALEVSDGHVVLRV